MPGDGLVIEEVRQVLQRHLSPSAKMVLAVSGGLDSIVLMHALRLLREESGWSLTVCHVHHGIRGEEADRDAAFVEQEAHNIHMPFIGKRVDVPRQLQQGESQETGARRLRYQALVEVAETVGAQVILTAHHRQDQAETVLMRVLRGTGVTGLAGIQEVRQLGAQRLIRPLLYTSRDDIAAWALSEGLSYVEDSSNSCKDYTRNRVRLELMPQLARQYNPKIVHHLAQLADLAAQDDRYLQEMAREAYAKVVTWYELDRRFAELDTLGLRALPLALQRRVITLVLEYAEPGVLWPFYRVEAVRSACVNEDSGISARSVGHGWSVVSRLGKLQLLKTADLYGRRDPVWNPVPIVTDSGPIVIAGAGYAVHVEESPHPSVFPAAKWETYVSCDAEPMTLRPWRQGDRIEPLGMNGHSRLISDILVDGKVPRDKRTGYPVLTSDEIVVWVPGLSRSRHYVVEPDDRRCWHLEVRKPL